MLCLQYLDRVDSSYLSVQHIKTSQEPKIQSIHLNQIETETFHTVHKLVTLDPNPFTAP